MSQLSNWIVGAFEDIGNVLTVTTYVACCPLPELHKKDPASVLLKTSPRLLN